MKKSILKKVRAENMAAIDVQVDQDKDEVQMDQDKDEVQVDQDKDELQVDQDKDDVQVDQDKDDVDVDMDAGKVIFKEEATYERYVKIAQMTNELMAASTGPGPVYEIVWRKQDAPGNRRKPFIHPQAKGDRNPSRREKEWLEMGQDKDDVQVGLDKDDANVDMDVDKGIFKEEDPSERHIKIAKMTNDLMAASTGPGPLYEIVWRKQDAPENRRKPFIHPRAKEARNEERPPTRREREWLELGNQFEPIVTVFGPGHFLHHSGYGGGQGEMFQLEDGSVIKGIDADDDIPEKREPTALERSLMEQRKFFEDDDPAFDL